MGVVPARLVFLAFIGLTGAIIYNALYLQETHGTAMIPTVVPVRASEAAPAAPNPPSTPPVQTSQPQPEVQEALSDLVKAVQRELKIRGYDSGPADGKMRDDTKKAIAAFEKDAGLTVTGVPSDELLHQILLGERVKPSAATGSVQAAVSAPVTAAPPAAKETSTVKAVQQVLADLGYAPGEIDGAMGASTVHAVTAFQHDRKIAQNGRITPELLREIKRVTGHEIASSAAH
jgi:peptidoglycan hydrolase-like protein with peptidoglycan-binding domain